MISPERREEKRREGKGREGTKLHIAPDDLTWKKRREGKGMDKVTHSTGGSHLWIENKDKYIKVIKMKKFLSKKKERIKKKREQAE